MIACFVKIRTKRSNPVSIEHTAFAKKRRSLASLRHSCSEKETFDYLTGKAVARH